MSMTHVAWADQLIETKAGDDGDEVGGRLDIGVSPPQPSDGGLLDDVLCVGRAPACDRRYRTGAVSHSSKAAASTSDVATSAHPQQVRDLFRNSRLIGRRFRLVHVFFGRQNVEVATFRKQAEAVADTDDPLIRLDNTFGTPEEDAFRRDFTVNALFYDPQTFHGDRFSRRS